MNELQGKDSGAGSVGKVQSSSVEVQKGTGTEETPQYQLCEVSLCTTHQKFKLIRSRQLCC